MTPFPHHYHAHAAGAAQGTVSVRTLGVGPLRTTAPPEFGGPTGHWTPEALLVAAVADCFVLSFRVVARGAQVDFESLDVDAEGVLDRQNGVTRFTAFIVRPRLRLPPGGDDAAALAALHRAKQLCLITNSMNAPCELQPEILASEQA
jgi:organic hydroperoxide reductase OsmC/OhrA